MEFFNEFAMEFSLCTRDEQNSILCVLLFMELVFSFSCLMWHMVMGEKRGTLRMKRGALRMACLNCLEGAFCVFLLLWILFYLDSWKKWLPLPFIACVLVMRHFFRRWRGRKIKEERIIRIEPCGVAQETELIDHQSTGSRTEK